MLTTMVSDAQVTTKKCPKCGETKSSLAFYRDKNRKDGLRGHCKACSRAQYRGWYRENPDKARERRRAWERNNPERVLERVRKWQRDNPDKHLEIQQRHSRKRAMHLSSRVRRVVPMILHFEGRDATLERLAEILAKRKDFHSLCWLSADIEDLAVRYYYKEEI